MKRKLRKLVVPVPHMPHNSPFLEDQPSQLFTGGQNGEKFSFLAAVGRAPSQPTDTTQPSTSLHTTPLLRRNDPALDTIKLALARGYATDEERQNCPVFQLNSESKMVKEALEGFFSVRKTTDDGSEGAREAEHQRKQGDWHRRRKQFIATYKKLRKSVQKRANEQAIFGGNRAAARKAREGKREKPGDNGGKV